MMKTRKTFKISKNNCDLIFFNKFKKFIKTPERIFFLKAYKDCQRGKHAHKKCSQFLFPINGNIKIFIDNGKTERSLVVKLGTILKIGPLNCLKINLKKNQILAVLCDKPYSKNEYIRNYEKFKEITKKLK